MRLFHYTDSHAFQGIQWSGVIHPSGRGRYGPGVYLTDLSPDHHDRQEIAEMIYRGGANRSLTTGRLDHHIQLEIPKGDVVHCRPHVYRYIGSGSGLMLSNHMIVSKGDNEAWQMSSRTVAAAGLVLATAVAVPSALEAVYKHATNGRQSRTQVLYNTLVQLITDNGSQKSFCVKLSEDGGVVQVHCRCCSKSVSEQYSGGYIFASNIDEKALLQTLNKHKLFHEISRVLYPTVAVVVAVCACSYWWYMKGAFRG